MKKKRSLRNIVDELQFMTRAIDEGEEIDLERLDQSGVDLKDKCEAIIFSDNKLEMREDWLRKEKSRIDEEIRWTVNERKNLKDYAANELIRIGVKTLMTNLYRVTVALGGWQMIPRKDKKVLDREELGEIDDRCVKEETTFEASRSLAKEVLLQTGEIPIGFEARKNPSLRYKRTNDADE